MTVGIYLMIKAVCVINFVCTRTINSQLCCHLNLCNKSLIFFQGLAFNMNTSFSSYQNFAVDILLQLTAVQITLEMYPPHT